MEWGDGHHCSRDQKRLLILPLPTSSNSSTAGTLGGGELVAVIFALERTVFEINGFEDFCTAIPVQKSFCTENFYKFLCNSRLRYQPGDGEIKILKKILGGDDPWGLTPDPQIFT